MSRRLVVLQPSYLPWLGFFDQLFRSDLFVFYDDVQYTKNDWRNRNRIKTPNGVAWMTVPVSIEGRISEHLLINEVRISDEPRWREKHLKTLLMNYARAPHFHEVFPLLEGPISKPRSRLIDLNLDLVEAVCSYLGLQREILLSSQIGVAGSGPSDRLVKMCERVEATVYLSGSAARDYLEVDPFRQRGIAVEWHDYAHPRYNQLWGEFVPHLSVVDLLFNHGKNSLGILTNGSKEAK